MEQPSAATGWIDEGDETKAIRARKPDIKCRDVYWVKGIYVPQY